MSSTWKTKAELLQGSGLDVEQVVPISPWLLRRLLHPAPLPRPLHVVHPLPWPHHVVVVVGPIPFSALPGDAPMTPASTPTPRARARAAEGFLLRAARALGVQGHGPACDCVVCELDLDDVAWAIEAAVHEGRADETQQREEADAGLRAQIATELGLDALGTPPAWGMLVTLATDRGSRLAKEEIATQLRARRRVVLSAEGRLDDMQAAYLLGLDDALELVRPSSVTLPEAGPALAAAPLPCPGGLS